MPFEYLKLHKMYIYIRECCFDWLYDHGTFQFEVAFSSDIYWTDKHYIKVYPFDFHRRDDWWVSYDPDVSEFLCYFDLNSTLFSAKSEYCFRDPITNILTIWPPEETNLLAGNRMLINIDWRG
jgi:hypothetical protein